MSWLFLLMIPPVALASFRLLASHIANAAAAVVAVVVAVAATVLPAWALRTKPSHGSPVETPVGPAFRGGRAELLVDYVSGWSQPAQRAGQTVRLLSGHGELAVGPLQSRRPRATLSFRASAAAATTVVVRYGDAVVERARVATSPSRVAIPVEAGNGPAVFDLDVATGGTIIVPIASVHAFVSR